MRDGLMGQFEEEAKAFGARGQEKAAEAGQIAALSLICGADLYAALKTPPSERAALVRKLEHAIERERLKGMRRHWSYDLNRHIALKQVLDRLRGRTDARPRCGAGIPGKAESTKTNGARWRR
jgi:hypothetical protein